jgi:hypothetical protein
MQQELFKIRDKRNKGWFFMDNEYLNGYAKIFGAVGTAIYVSLCRHADNEQKCFPSENLIGEELSISDRTVRTYLGKFEKYKLIRVERTVDSRTKRRMNNTYWLLDKTEWQPHPEETTSCGQARGNKQQNPEETNDKSQRNQFPIKDTNNKNTNNKNTNIATLQVADPINPLIELFSGVNPTYKRLYADKTQRACLDRLLKLMGREKLEGAIKILETTNQRQYAPVITTPYELEKKMGSLIAFVKKEKITKKLPTVAKIK